MSQVGEAVSVMIIKIAEEKCPWKQPDADDVEVKDENPMKDDRDSVAKLQGNNGGILGQNLINASSGKRSTINSICPPPSPAKQEGRIDTRRTRGSEKIYVSADGKKYPYTVAAHHLIPGKASLAPSDVYNYMEAGKKVSSSPEQGGFTWTIQKHIGYNVNGSHNGIWLPGNYAIRRRHSPVRRVSWSGLEAAGMGDWCISYIAALSKKTNRQFHDSHTLYNTKVLKQLNKIATALLNHQIGCKECQDKNGKEILPPYSLKNRLYAISQCLHQMVSGNLRSWSKSYLTSDRLRRILGNPITLQKFEDE